MRANASTAEIQSTGVELGRDPKVRPQGQLGTARVMSTPQRGSFCVVEVNRIRVINDQPSRDTLYDVPQEG